MCPMVHILGGKRKRGKKRETKNDSCVKDMDAFCLNILRHAHPDIVKQDIFKWILKADLCLVLSVFEGTCVKENMKDVMAKYKRNRCFHK